MLGSRGCFNGSKFNVVLSVGERWSFIEGWLLEGEEKVVEFYVCTLRDLVDARKR